MVAAREHPRTLAIQNDGDEIINARPLLHLRDCDIKTGENQIAMPCVLYKQTTHWLPVNRPLDELRRWRTADLADASVLLTFATHWWMAGPTVLELTWVSCAYRLLLDPFKFARQLTACGVDRSHYQSRSIIIQCPPSSINSCVVVVVAVAHPIPFPLLSWIPRTGVEARPVATVQREGEVATDGPRCRHTPV